MRREVKKYLFDIATAARRIMRFTEGKTFQDYQGDEMLRSAVERQFEIIGEALAQLARRDEIVATYITDYRRIIAFRNILAHGYAQIDDLLVWDIVETKLPLLYAQVVSLLGEQP